MGRATLDRGAPVRAGDRPQRAAVAQVSARIGQDRGAPCRALEDGDDL
jgi:hypothetical protein